MIVRIIVNKQYLIVRTNNNGNYNNKNKNKDNNNTNNTKEIIIIQYLLI